MLVDQDIADDFLFQYKQLLFFLNDDVEPEELTDYVQIRNLLYENLESAQQQYKAIVGADFLNSLLSAIFGKFVYLKKYRNGYVLMNVQDNTYYQVLALTTPLEHVVHEYSVIETAIVPFKDQLLCDGLIQHQGMFIGKNMSKELRDGYWDAKRSGELVVLLD